MAPPTPCTIEQAIAFPSALSNGLVTIAPDQHSIAITSPLLDRLPGWRARTPAGHS